MPIDREEAAPCGLCSSVRTIESLHGASVFKDERREGAVTSKHKSQEGKRGETQGRENKSREDKGRKGQGRQDKSRQIAKNGANAALNLVMPATVAARKVLP